MQNQESVRSTKSRGTNEFDSHVGRRLRAARTLAGMSQTRLGQAVGLTFQQIQKYEKGVNRIGASRLQQFAEILNVSVSFFFETEIGSGVQEALPAAAVEQDNILLAGQQRIAAAGGASARETMELLRQFGMIRDPMVRRAFIDLLRQVNQQNAAQAMPADADHPPAAPLQAQSAE